MSERADAEASFCGLCDAGSDLLELAGYAYERRRDEIIDGWSDEAIASAADALECCQYLGCRVHRDDAAIRLLRGILEEIDELATDPLQAEGDDP